MLMESTVAEAAENLANYTTKVEAEWQSCGVLRERLEQLQTHLADVEAMYERKVARLEEQITALQADNASTRERLSSAAGSSCPRTLTTDAETSAAAAATEAAAAAQLALQLARAKVVVASMDSGDGHICPTHAAQQIRQPPVPPATPRMSASRLSRAEAVGASAKLSVERLRAHDEGLQELCRPSPMSPHRKSRGELRANTEPRRNHCETSRALTRSGEHVRPPWTARTSVAAAPSEPVHNLKAQAGHGRPERPKGRRVTSTAGRKS